MNDVALPRMREATGEEADDLAQLERSASLQALSHIFPPGAVPVPDR